MTEDKEPLRGSRTAWRGALAGLLVLALAGCDAPKPQAPLRPSAPVIIRADVAAPPKTSVKILTCCDSITVGIGTTSYREELTRLLRARGIEPVWVVAAVSGSTCELWTSLLGDLISTNKPDIVLVNCGTNDRLDSDSQILGFQTVHARIIDMARASGARVAVSSVQYSRVGGRPELAWLVASESRVNRAIKSTAFAFGDVAYADIAAIPATPENNPDGIHPGTLGDSLYAAAWLSAGAARGWWNP